MTTDPPEPKARRKWHFYKWLVLLIVATSAYAQWRAYTFRSALKEAKALGWEIIYIDPVDEIRENWKAALKKETWREEVKFVRILKGEEFVQHHDIVLRLNPKELEINAAQTLHDLSALDGLTRLEAFSINGATRITNVDALRNFSLLKLISIAGASALTNLDPIKALTALTEVNLSDCTDLTNVDGLKNLPVMEAVSFVRCTALTNMNALKNLTTLQQVVLMDCTGLINVDGLKSLSTVSTIIIDGCTSLQQESIETLKATLPNTAVITDEPSPLPKPNELNTTPGVRDTDR